MASIFIFDRDRDILSLSFSIFAVARFKPLHLYSPKAWMRPCHQNEIALEYINGQIIQKPMLQGKHSKLQDKLVTAINAVTEERKIALAFPELRCTFGGRSIVPDVAVFAWNRIPMNANGEVENVFRTQPDWTIEILWPVQRLTKVIGNILHCLNHGCQMG